MTYAHTGGYCHEFHDLVRDFGGERPTIVVLCGSTRFVDEFRRQTLRLTLDGYIVLSIGCDTKSDADLEAAGLVEFTPGLKARLDELHLRKIDLADEVRILDCPVGGVPYVGESTRREIEYATRLGKPVRYLSRERRDDFVADPRAETNEALAEMGATAGDAAAEVERLRAKATPLNLAAVTAAQWGKTSAELDMEHRPRGAAGDPDWVPGFGPVPGSGSSS